MYEKGQLGAWVVSGGCLEDALIGVTEKCLKCVRILLLFILLLLSLYHSVLFFHFSNILPVI